ncbi:MAG: hypothetical protein JWM98_1813 [Thermoleophilia bacterium]|nr:hypothetical protein [Thermoleophilia bacterium]
MKALRDQSLVTLQANRAKWVVRLAARRRALARTRGTLTSWTPRTKLTPSEKPKLVSRQQQSVAVAEKAVQLYDDAIQWKRMPLRLRALTEFRKWLDVREQGGNNRGPEVERIIRANGGVPGEPWCADTDAAAYLAAGSKAVTRAWAAVRNLGRLAGMYVLGSKRAGLAGDIVAFTFDHTGLLVGYCNQHGDPAPGRVATHVHTIEGNTSSGGAVSDGNGADGVFERIRPLTLVDRVVRVTR